MYGSNEVHTAHSFVSSYHDMVTFESFVFYHVHFALPQKLYMAEMNSVSVLWMYEWNQWLYEIIKQLIYKEHDSNHSLILGTFGNVSQWLVPLSHNVAVWQQTQNNPPQNFFFQKKDKNALLRPFLVKKNTVTFFSMIAS